MLAESPSERLSWDSADKPRDRVVGEMARPHYPGPCTGALEPFLTTCLGSYGRAGQSLDGARVDPRLPVSL